MVYYVGSNFCRMFRDRKFWICSAVMALMFLTTVADNDPVTNDSITILDMLIDKSRYRRIIELNAVSLFAEAESMWMIMFAPVLTAFAFLPSVMEDRRNGFVRYEIGRIGKFRYYAGNFLTATVGGGLIVMLGGLLAAAVIFSVFPVPQEFGAAEMEVFAEMLTDGKQGWYAERVISGETGGILLICSLKYFAFGVLASLPAVFISVFIKNIYLVISVPFFFCHIWEKLKGYFASVDFRVYEKMAPLGFSPLLDITDKNALTGTKKTVFYNLALLAAAFFVYVFVQCRKVDQSES